MSVPARERLVTALDGHATHSKFCTRLELDPRKLSVTVDGIGPLSFPIGPKRAGDLIALAAPARYGLGQQTLTDPAVRDTWEVPQHLVHTQWADGSLEKVLAAAREGLGLPDTGELSAQPHSVLVYDKGQFFLPHQDSEKHDEMIGTLVVTLPSRFQGGELVINHGKASEVCGGSAERISVTAFYGDCRHEVRRVRSGRRITLTYNLLHRGGAQPSPAARDPRTGPLAQLLEEHFQTAAAHPYSRTPAAPPQRLAFLLDHEYTEKNLAWRRLKGEDAHYAELLRTAAHAADCQIMLGLTEVQETWDAYPADEYRHGRYDYYDEGPDESEGDGEYELIDVIDSSVSLVRWIDPESGETEKIRLDISPREICTRTEHPRLEPYEQSYEGYMGNYGNTLDRWYRRAALIIWPRRLEFANRAESSPGWGLRHLLDSARAGKLDQTRELARTLAPFWRDAIEPDAPEAWLTNALTIAKLLDHAEIAALLLGPFKIQHLRAIHAEPLASAAETYGPAWTEQLIDTWMRENRHGADIYLPPGTDWIKHLPDLCHRLHTTNAAGAAAAVTLLNLTWQAVRRSVDGTLKHQKTPSRRTASLAQSGPDLATLLTAAEQAHATATRDAILDHLSELDATATPLLLTTLRELAARPPAERSSAFTRIADACSRSLHAELAAAERATDDWSITLPNECGCALCHDLAAFLNSPNRTTLTWPLAKTDRRHIHSRIDNAELPVTHTTLREGRPHKLVLTKTEALFTGDQNRRATAQAVLIWIEALN